MSHLPGGLHPAPGMVAGCHSRRRLTEWSAGGLLGQLWVGASLVGGMRAPGPTIRSPSFSSRVRAGCFSAAGGRYTEERTLWEIHAAAIQQERASLEADPEGELDELTGIYEAKGLTPELAGQVARELMHRDPVAAHVDAELHLADLGPSSGALAAGATAGLSFTAGATLPLLAMQLLPLSERMVLTFIGVLLGLALTGWFASWLTKLPPWRLIRRNVTIGLTAMLLSLLVAALIAPAH